MTDDRIEQLKRYGARMDCSLPVTNRSALRCVDMAPQRDRRETPEE